MRKLGLIAGDGKLPVLLAQEAPKHGWEVFAFAVEGEAKADILAPLVKKLQWVRADQLGALIEMLHEEDIKDVVMAGKVRKKRLYTELKPDARTLKIFLSLPDNTDDTLLGAVASELESEGITLHPTTLCLNGVMAEDGLIVGTPPTKEQWRDIRFGWKIAKEIGRMDIGQTVVVRNGAVMAVEAIEGTDEAIKRGGLLGGSGTVVVKVAKPQQDLRFDVPAVGMETINSMILAKASILAIEAGWTIFLERKEVLQAAKNAGITLVATRDPENEGQNT